MFVDVDDFKLVNDSLGHGAGDRLLEAVAQRLTAALRPQDVVARFGGDEFTVLVADVADEDDALRRRRAAGRGAASRRSTSTASRASSPPRSGWRSRGSGDADQLLQDADAAMYRAKANGKARCDTFDDSLRADAIRRLALESGLREALARDAADAALPAAGPAARTATITGAEALIRWQHPDLGAVSPAEFIPMAERLGVIEEIGAWVVRTACAEAVAWGRDDLEIAVNVSPRQLSSPDFADVVRDALATSGLEPHRLCLEVTETALLADVDAAHAMLARLRALGVLLAVDDFGVGHASLRHLRQLLPVDVLKIDKSFVDGLAEDREDAAIVSAVVRLAEGLGLDCVAEGVETAEQAAALSAMGCSNAQGYHFARPMRAEALRAALTPRRRSRRRADARAREATVAGGTRGGASKVGIRVMPTARTSPPRKRKPAPKSKTTTSAAAARKRRPAARGSAGAARGRARKRSSATWAPRVPVIEQRHLDLMGLALIAVGVFLSFPLYLGWDGGQAGDGVVNALALLVGDLRYVAPIGDHLRGRRHGARAGAAVGPAVPDRRDLLHARAGADVRRGDARPRAEHGPRRLLEPRLHARPRRLPGRVAVLRRRTT